LVYYSPAGEIIGLGRGVGEEVIVQLAIFKFGKITKAVYLEKRTVRVHTVIKILKNLIEKKSFLC